jgi:DNA-binding NarL/FixJ family response regulator
METPLTRIALADDHAFVRYGVSSVISKWKGYKVILEAANGKDLLSKLRKADPLPDILLLDISMPVMDGHEVMPVIRAQYPSISVVVLTVYGNEYATYLMFLAGAQGYVEKGNDPKNLLRAIKAVKMGEKYFNTLAISNVSQKLTPVISPREGEFLKLCCKDMPYKEIAAIMGVSTETVQTFRQRLFRKLDIKSRGALMLFALKAGLVTQKDILP